MDIPFRQHHILAILEGYDQQSLPLDLFLKDYLRLHKALGSKDRAYIADTVYALVRWKGLCDYLGDGVLNWSKRLEIFFDSSFDAAKKRMDIPDHIRLSFPKELFDCLAASHGLEKAREICEISNQPAPTTVRVNVLKTNREVMLARWKGLYDVHPCEFSPNGIVFKKRINFSSTPEYREGLFEVQDEGSQLLAELVKAKPGDLVMDYCAGSGGKTLAFAPRMQNKGQIYLHDVRKHVLQESRIRLRRAGIQNAQVVVGGDEKLKKLKKTMDWVLVDAPCSGTGTMRRNPDMKWKFEKAKIPAIQGQQRMIFEKALSYLKPSGRIVYATCSLLHEENGDQIAHFMETYDLVLAEDVFESLPIMNGMDGFYGAVFKRNCAIGS
jgi:16S rRNA (cytosine967-C5)-methyltransferase